MESVMVKVIGTIATGAILLGLTAMTGAALAETSAPAAPAKCEVAEVNPVTGHVICIKPLGAPVERPPAEAAAPCNPDQARGQWTWGPNCTEIELKGM
jgi:hypothetical protein